MEETQKELQNNQQEYSRLCAQLGHCHAQTLANNKVNEQIAVEKDKITHQLEVLFKKNSELQNKINFEAKKETKVEVTANPEE